MADTEYWIYADGNTTDVILATCVGNAPISVTGI